MNIYIVKGKHIKYPKKLVFNTKNTFNNQIDSLQEKADYLYTNLCIINHDTTLYVVLNTIQKVLSELGISVVFNTPNLSINNINSISDESIVKFIQVISKEENKDVLYNYLFSSKSKVIIN